MVCSRVICIIDPNSQMISKIRSFLEKTQNKNGGWGDPLSTPLDTAFAILTMSNIIPTKFWNEEQGIEIINNAISYLCSSQRNDGSWKGTGFIKMVINRARIQRKEAKPSKVLIYKSDAITTSFCLKALVQYSRKFMFESK